MISTAPGVAIHPVGVLFNPGVSDKLSENTIDALAGESAAEAIAALDTAPPTQPHLCDIALPLVILP